MYFLSLCMCRERKLVKEILGYMKFSWSNKEENNG